MYYTLSTNLVYRYGVGYHMTLVKERQCDSAQVTEMVLSIVRGAEQVTDVGAELSFVLPSNATPQFPELFKTLEGTFTRVCNCKRLRVALFLSFSLSKKFETIRRLLPNLFKWTCTCTYEQSINHISTDLARCCRHFIQSHQYSQ